MIFSQTSRTIRPRAVSLSSPRVPSEPLQPLRKSKVALVLVTRALKINVP